MSLNKLLNKTEYFSFAMKFHSANEHIFENKKRTKSPFSVDFCICLNHPVKNSMNFCHPSKGGEFRREDYIYKVSFSQSKNSLCQTKPF
ncbi:hypothetical protein SAMN05421785_110137 [Chryseobacterium gambrini]|uniref:Uncharacterized protein n=1 Tax=Chryseobacterium gambrini TaxID=373672 RepID=A0A1N7QDA3_9FLAO|nr:hypothetical protein SAMN05421785_110137 [Chryseobacterium gambrini]